MGSRHWDEDGSLRMVDVSGKATTVRRAVVEARLELLPCHVQAVSQNPKGDVFAAARLAGIQAAKHCWELIPLCHQVALKSVQVDLVLEGESILIRAESVAEDVTGVEMEAYCAAATAGLTLIDMLKGVDPHLTLTDIRLTRKTGGKSTYERK